MGRPNLFPDPKPWQRTQGWRRALSVTLAFALALTSLPVPPTVWAAPTTPVSIPDSASSTLNLAQLDLDAFTIPEQLGYVAETWQPSDGVPKGLLLHIQDLHTHPEAQAHISDLIGYLHDQMGIELVALEGAEGTCDTSFFSSFPDAAITEQISRVFVEHGLFTGAEHYAITHPGRVTLWGIEDAQTYLEHLQTYQQGAAYQGQAEETLKTLRKTLQPLADTLYPKSLRRLLTLRQAADAEEAPEHAFSTYVSELLRLGEQVNLDLKAYPQVRTFGNAVQLYRTLDMRLVEIDQDRLLKGLWPSLSPSERDRLDQLTQAVNEAQVPPARYYEALAEVARAHDAPLRPALPSRQPGPKTLQVVQALLLGAPASGRRDYHALRQYLTYLKLSDRIHPRELTQEVEVLEQTLEATLFTTDRQRALASLLKWVDLVEDLVAVRLSPEQLDNYQRSQRHFTPETLWPALRQVTRGQPSVTRAQLQHLIESLPTQERFYELATARDEAFIQNTVQQLNDQQVSSAILITGGFHTRGLTQRFKDRNIAYAVITPKVEGSFPKTMYYERLQGYVPNPHALLKQLRESSDALQAPIGSGAPGVNQEVTYQGRQLRRGAYLGLLFAAAFLSVLIGDGSTVAEAAEVLPETVSFSWTASSWTVEGSGGLLSLDPELLTGTAPAAFGMQLGTKNDVQMTGISGPDQDTRAVQQGGDFSIGPTVEQAGMASRASADGEAGVARNTEWITTQDRDAIRRITAQHQQEVTMKLAAIPNASFSDVLATFQAVDSAKPGLLYRLERAPTIEELHQLATFDGEIIVSRVRETDLWVMQLRQLGRGNHVQPAENLEAYQLWNALAASDLFDMTMRNHPQGLTPVPELDDLLWAAKHGGRHFLITTNRLIEYHTDHLTSPDGRLMWAPGLEPIILPEILINAGVDPKALERLEGEARITQYLALYEQLHFTVLPLSWEDATTGAPAPGMFEEVDAAIPQRRLRALAQLNELRTLEGAGPPDLYVRMVGHFARHDPDEAIRSMASRELARYRRFRLREEEHANPIARRLYQTHVLVGAFSMLGISFYIAHNALSLFPESIQNIPWLTAPWMLRHGVDLFSGYMWSFLVYQIFHNWETLFATKRTLKHDLMRVIATSLVVLLLASARMALFGYDPYGLTNFLVWLPGIAFFLLLNSFRVYFHYRSTLPAPPSAREPAPSDRERLAHIQTLRDRLTHPDSDLTTRRYAAKNLVSLEREELAAFQAWLTSQGMLEDSVVSVGGLDQLRGSGFVWFEDPEHVYIVTNTHVVRGAATTPVVVSRGEIDKEFDGVVIVRYKNIDPSIDPSIEERQYDAALVAVRKSDLEQQGIVLKPVRVADELESQDLIGQHAAVISGSHQAVMPPGNIYRSDSSNLSIGTFRHPRSGIPGASGSPVVIRVNEEPVVVGVLVGVHMRAWIPWVPFPYRDMSYEGALLTPVPRRSLLERMRQAVPVLEAASDAAFVSDHPSSLRQAMRVLLPALLPLIFIPAGLLTLTGVYGSLGGVSQAGIFDWQLWLASWVGGTVWWTWSKPIRGPDDHTVTSAPPAVLSAESKRITESENQGQEDDPSHEAGMVKRRREFSASATQVGDAAFGQLGSGVESENVSSRKAKAAALAKMLRPPINSGERITAQAFEQHIRRVDRDRNITLHKVHVGVFSYFKVALEDIRRAWTQGDPERVLMGLSNLIGLLAFVPRAWFRVDPQTGQPTMLIQLTGRTAFLTPVLVLALIGFGVALSLPHNVLTWFILGAVGSIYALSIVRNLLEGHVRRTAEATLQHELAHLYESLILLELERAGMLNLTPSEAHEVYKQLRDVAYPHIIKDEDLQAIETQVIDVVAPYLRPGQS